MSLLVRDVPGSDVPLNQRGYYSPASTSRLQGPLQGRDAIRPDNGWWRRLENGECLPATTLVLAPVFSMTQEKSSSAFHKERSKQC